MVRADDRGRASVNMGSREHPNTNLDSDLTNNETRKLYMVNAQAESRALEDSDPLWSCRGLLKSLDIGFNEIACVFGIVEVGNTNPNSPCHLNQRCKKAKAVLHIPDPRIAPRLC